MGKKELKQTQVKTPELKRMLAVKEDSQRIGEFLEWLSEQEIMLAKWRKSNCICGEENPDQLAWFHPSREKLLADYFVIDLAKCETERQALLDAVREDNNG